MRAKPSRLLVALITMSLATILLLLWMRQPVMIHVSVASLTVFGPLRDRAPERAAEVFLEAIRDGQCRELEARSSPAIEFLNTDCEIEAKHPLASWELTRRVADENGEVHLEYVWGGPSVPISYRNPIQIDVKEIQEEWRVVLYDRIF